MIISSHVLLLFLPNMCTLIKICVYSALLSALSVVEMKTLDVVGHVGKNVTFECSGWDVWFSPNINVKYLCENACKKDTQIIIKAEQEKTEVKQRISITNTGKTLLVTFTNLKKSDSKKYQCGVERTGFDPLIEVNLYVLYAESTTPAPKTTSTTVTTASTLSSVSESNVNQSATATATTEAPGSASRAGAGSVLYLIIGFTIIITTLLVLLMLMRTMRKRQLKIVSRPDGTETVTQAEYEYDEIRPEDQRTVSQATSFNLAEPDSLYANFNYHQDVDPEADTSRYDSNALYSAPSSEARLQRACAENRVTDPHCDLVYSLAQLPKSQPHQSETVAQNDSLYSLVQHTRTT